MKSREISVQNLTVKSQCKIWPFSLACTNPYLGIGWEYQSMVYLSIDTAAPTREDYVQDYGQGNRKKINFS